jgi:hypothetical protein
VHPRYAGAVVALDILDEMRKAVSARDEGGVDYARVGAFALAPSEQR